MTGKHYNWLGIDSSGMKINGKSCMPSKAHLIKHLQEQKIQAIKIKRCYNFFTLKKTASTKTVNNFLTSLKTLLEAGIAMPKALAVIASGKNQFEFNQVILDIKDQIEQGKSFSSAIKKYESIFGVISVQLLALGEKTSAITPVMAQIIHYREKMHEIKREIQRALFYPVLILIVSILLMLFLIFHVAPNLTNIYRNLQAPLPLATQWLLTFFYAMAYALPFLVGAMCFVFWRIKKSYRTSIQFRLICDRMLLKLPVLGMLVQKINISSALFALYILIGANLPIKQALPLVAQSCMNQAYRLAWIAAYEKIKNGMALSQVLGADLFPEELTQLILIGEQSSALPTLLEKSYQAYLNELFNSLSRLAQLLEPLSILFLALMLGGIIIIMYLPIFQLGNLF